MNEAPKFEEYSYETLLEVYEGIDEMKFPDRKARVAELLEERKGSGEAKVLFERNKYSTFGPRFVAAIIDGICLLVIGFFFGIVVGIIPAWLVDITYYITSFGIIIYSVLLHGLYGQTIGKALMSVKVVNHSDEGDITFKQAFIRDCIPIAIWAATILAVMVAPVDTDGHLPVIVQYMLVFSGVFNIIWFLLEIVTTLLNEKRRAFHDYIADTVVINI
ncbi:RDD family protein [Simiduia aestuariiviva]|uniref:Putative RDD family membrane protein YckC n=1 Tax=Simiduia aestuariiviva TaxID=1510459 RepID=A0A839UL45_9GAMM|nr:RDD family protein [Simiduia aestuariiviva]MBB3167299.1 putative RDD family membrane protein YckC [Simiduia aestuariiviva]